MYRFWRKSVVYQVGKTPQVGDPSRINELTDGQRAQEVRY